MRQLLVAVLVMVVLPCAVAFAREEPEFEVFAGYSYLSTSILQDTGFVQLRKGLNGWNASTTWNSTHNLGFTADFGGYYASPFLLGGGSVKTHYYSFLGGPQVTHHTRKVELFLHQLVGLSRDSMNPGTQAVIQSGFTIAAGGGLDYVITKRWAIRVFQADYVIGELGPHYKSQNQFRFSAGICRRWSFVNRGNQTASLSPKR